MLSAAGNGAIEGVIMASIVVPVMILAIVCWIFWRAAKRDGEARSDEAGGTARPD